ncbi:CU044_2847 family protein [Streptomyces seoulensis]|uniref:CU044_2847 family protein n=1 Tax=Streptomyces seoulensis TaxID=73044 RepID=UPI003C2E69C1
MDGDSTRVARIELPDGTPVWARISGAGEPAYTEELSYTDTGFHERVEASVESLHSLITGVARSLAGPLSAVRPDEVSVEFGIELTAKAGKVVGLLADGEAKAALTVTLTWNGGPPEPGTAPGGGGPVPAGGAGPGAGPTGTGPRPGGPLPGAGPAPGTGPAPTAPAGGPAPAAPGARSGPASRTPSPDPQLAYAPDTDPARRDLVPVRRAPVPEPSAADPAPVPAPRAYPAPAPRTSAPQPSPPLRPEALSGVWGHPG